MTAGITRTTQTVLWPGIVLGFLSRAVANFDSEIGHFESYLNNKN
jgi:hypothetical protein